MEINQKKSKSLFSFFLKHLIGFCVFNLIVGTVLVLSPFLYMSFGLVLPANYAEKKLEEVRDELENGEPFDAELIPFTCSYALFDENNVLVEGNMKKKDLSNAKKIISGNGEEVYGYYFFAPRKDGSCIVRYDISVHFASETLHKIVPKPVVLVVFPFILCFVGSTIVTAMQVGKKLKSQLVPLVTATNAIKNQELTFSISPTKIKEFNAVLDSIEDMKSALKDSLEKQWEEEQNRRTQIAALTHDIKTPLTLVKGNAELLLESELQGEPAELSDTIYHSAEKIEQYLALLMDATTAENLGSFEGETFELEEFIEEVSAEAKALCLTKQLCFQLEKEKLPQTFCGDRTLLFRGLMNILNNAVEYSPLGGRIGLSISYNDRCLICVIRDEGKGFSTVALKHGVEQFYTEAQERSGEHYGMGLFIAKSAAEKHNGKLFLSNDKKGGAMVTLYIYSCSV